MEDFGLFEDLAGLLTGMNSASQLSGLQGRCFLKTRTCLKANFFKP